MKFVFVFFIVCAAVVTFHQVEGKQKGRKDEEVRHGKYDRKERVNKHKRMYRHKEVYDKDCNCKVECDSEKEREDEDEDGLCCKTMKCCKTCNDTLQCKGGDGICKQTCGVNEEDTGPCCNSNRCCQPPACNETLQYAQCKARNGESKPLCDVNEQDTGIGPFCNDNRCCEPPTCIAKKDCICKKTSCNSNEYEENIGTCSGSDTCCKPCCLTCGGTFNGPVGSFTSPNYPSDYCNNQNCYYIITVEEGSKIMLNFTNVHLEISNGVAYDLVKVYDGEITIEALLDTLPGGPTGGIEFNSTSNKMIIHFESDGSTTFPGFSAIYKTLQ
ncbi:CUBN [Mytilus coruscus]|uniref:CUBN n=1 Tax=Mytilus coruscus TaxID=42192 RepID=A0A6J8BZE6_MYTCO|nr:CUBN [Mytilus coruscus]